MQQRIPHTTRQVCVPVRYAIYERQTGELLESGEDTLIQPVSPAQLADLVSYAHREQCTADEALLSVYRRLASARFPHYRIEIAQRGSATWEDTG